MLTSIFFSYSTRIKIIFYCAENSQTELESELIQLKVNGIDKKIKDVPHDTYLASTLQPTEPPDRSNPDLLHFRSMFSISNKTHNFINLLYNIFYCMLQLT